MKLTVTQQMKNVATRIKSDRAAFLSFLRNKLDCFILTVPGSVLTKVFVLFVTKSSSV